MLLKEIIILEIDTPQTNWGYWIDDKGTLIAVGTGKTHMDVVRELFKTKEKPYDEAFKLGWIRVVFDQTDPKKIGIEIVDNVAPNAKQSIVQLIKKYKDSLREITVDISKGKMYKVKEFKAPYGIGKAINYIINSF